MDTTVVHKTSVQCCFSMFHNYSSSWISGLCPQEFVFFCSRGFVIPESRISGFLIRTGRRPAVTLPVDSEIHWDEVMLLFPLSFNYVPAFSKKACRKLKCVFREERVSFCPRGFVIPESIISGFSIRTGRRPAVTLPVDCKFAGTRIHVQKT